MVEWNYARILQTLPHRYPFLLVDKVVDIHPNETATGIKNVTLAEPVFQGHFPGDPIFPGVLIIEAMAQTAAVLALASRKISSRVGEMETIEDGRRPSIYFMTIDDVKFRQPVRPGDVLQLKVNRVQERGKVWKFSGEAFVDGRLVSEATFMAMIQEEA